MATKAKMTKRQKEVYDFIRDKIQLRGYGPTVREIADHFGIRSPNGVMCHLVALSKKGLIHREPNMSRAITLLEESPNQQGIALSGTIMAGQPIETYEDRELVNFYEMFPMENCFALKVRGDSMIEDHIEEGDFVIIKKQRTARDGQIVVAMLNETETTLKRFYKEKNRIRLMPANSKMKPIYAKKVDILGVVVGLLRNY